jgi:hypothetical protein
MALAPYAASRLGAGYAWDREGNRFRVSSTRILAASFLLIGADDLPFNWRSALSRNLAHCCAIEFSKYYPKIQKRNPTNEH